MAAADLARAQAALASTLAQATRVIDCSDPTGRQAAARLVRILREADQLLGRKLQAQAARFGGPDARFTGAQAVVYREQIRRIVDYVDDRLLGSTEAQARHAIQASLTDTTRILGTLERSFTGISAPLRLAQAAVFDATSRGVRASRLRAHATSVDRYGEAMIGEFERTLAVGMAAGLSQWEMVNSLTGHAGPRGRVSMAATVRGGQVVRLREEDIPEGLFSRYRSWAWRIVRTETAHAYNEARLVGLYAIRDSDFPDLKKKILAHFDNRTAYDSIVVHGQVRDLDGFFEDGAGRVYQRPPARPNDRETMIPWREHWPDVASTRPLPQSEVDRARAQLGTRALGRDLRDQDIAEEHAWARGRRREAERQRAIEARRRAAERVQAEQVTEPPQTVHTPQEAERVRTRAERAAERETAKAQRAAERAQRDARRAEQARAKARDRTFRGLEGEMLDFDASHMGAVRWGGQHIGSISVDGASGGWRGLLNVEDASRRAGMRQIESPAFRSQREAARWMARRQFDAEQDVIEARAAAGDPLARREARLRATGVTARPGSFRNEREARAWLQAAVGADVVSVKGFPAPNVHALTEIAQRIDRLPAGHVEALFQRGHRIRILPGNAGVGLDPRWGRQTHTFDGRPWARVEGAYSSGEDVTRFNVERAVREVTNSQRAADIIAHELGHAIDATDPRMQRTRLCESPEFLHILTAERGREALRAHGGWYVSDVRWECVRESWAEGYALSQSPGGRAFLERESPALLNYFDRVSAQIERSGEIPVVRGVPTSEAVPTRGSARLRTRRPIERTLDQAEEREVHARILARARADGLVESVPP